MIIRNDKNVKGLILMHLKKGQVEIYFHTNEFYILWAVQFRVLTVAVLLIDRNMSLGAFFDSKDFFKNEEESSSSLQSYHALRPDSRTVAIQGFKATDHCLC